MVLHFVQRHYTSDGDNSRPHNLNLVIAGSFFGFYMTTLWAYAIQAAIHTKLEKAAWYKKFFGDKEKHKAEPTDVELDEIKAGKFGMRLGKVTKHTFRIDGSTEKYPLSTIVLPVLLRIVFCVVLVGGNNYSST
jgi:hypothetical protein